MDYTKALFGSKMLLACMLVTQLGGVNEASAATGLKAVKTMLRLLTSHKLR